MVEFSYKNEIDRMVVLKCIGINNFFLERVVFPKETFVSQAPGGSKLEIWGNELYSPTLEKRMRIAFEKEEEQVAA